MGRRQEYIARVRYQNAVPPPPGAPKLLDHDVDTAPLLTAGSLSSAVFQRALVLEPDVELGMPIDLALDPRALDEPAIGELADPADLDPEDRELLGEPTPLKRTSAVTAASAASLSTAATELSSGVSDAANSVAFLRKTAYVTSDSQRTSIRRNAQKTAVFDPEAEVRRIEASFDHAQVPLEQLRHPKKKGVHAVRAKPLVPDIKQFDVEYTITRFLGSASLSQLPQKLPEELLQNSIFAQCGTAPNDWMSFFVPDSDEAAAALRARLEDKRDTLPQAELNAEASTVYDLRKIQDNDVVHTAHAHQFDEIVLTTDGESTFYVPVKSRTNLRRRRVDAKLRAQLRDDEVDILEVNLRELNADEQIERDVVRSQYDPVTYG